MTATTTTQTAMTTQTTGAPPAAPQTDPGATAPGPADTPRISGDLAARLLLSSRWQQ